MTRGQLTLQTQPRSMPTADIVAAYQKTGSVWEAGKLLGIAGQSVHERLRKISFPMANRNWTEAECLELRRLYDERVTLSQIAARLGRPYAGIACKASELGLKADQKGRRQKPERGSSPNKLATLRHMKAVEGFDGMVTHYARSQGIDIESLVHSFERHCPERWAAYVASRSNLAPKECPQCKKSFVPMGGKQIYCTRRCGTDYRQDMSYFGGKRGGTQGLASGVCQLCRKPDTTALSSHHILGRGNDPENEHLIALCRGCHKVVGMLASREWIETDHILSRLLQLAILRARGAQIADGSYITDTLNVQVQVVNWDEWAKICPPAGATA